MKSKKIIILVVSIVVLFLIIIGGYIGYKFYLVNKFEAEVNYDSLSYLRSNDDINIMVRTSLDDTYSTYNNLNFVLPDNFEKINAENNNQDIYQTDRYYLNYENENSYDASISISTYENIYDGIMNNDMVVFGESFKNADYASILEREEIYNNQELFEEIFDEYGEKVNIFDSSDEIKFNYLAHLIYNTLMGDYNIKLIDGDLEGYMYLYNNKIYEVHILKGNQSFVISFNNNNTNYFNEVNVRDFLTKIIL